MDLKKRSRVGVEVGKIRVGEGCCDNVCAVLDLVEVAGRWTTGGL